MVVDYIVDFTSYLNSFNFGISNNQIDRFFTMMQEEEIDFSDHEDLVELMKIVFCSNRNQCEELPNHFKNFIKERENFVSVSKMKKEKDENERNFNASAASKRTRINELKKEINDISKDVKSENNEIDKLLTKEEAKFVSENLEFIKKIKIKNKKAMNFIKDCIIKQDVERFLDYSSNFIETVAVEFVNLSEKALSKNKINDFAIYQKMFNIVKRLAKLETKYLKSIDAKIKKATQAQADKISELEKEIERESRKHKEIQDKLDRMINNINMKIVQKEKAETHRDVFIGKNAVQLTGEALPDFMEVDFKKLDRAAMSTIYYYIKKNLLKLKTRMTRNINTKEKQKIDIKATIQNACKTGGLPLVIHYEKPKANKTNLVLILDVSGSCKEASEMMLTFMYLLQSVFPGGCKTFAFVDSLYNISEIMKSEDIDQSVKNVLDVIPRRGVYSNYYKPLYSIWEENRNIITSDSIVIFMGDARNNKNPTGEEYVKNIARKAKKAYWLNTENFNEWGKADSLAFEYAKYFKMYEVLSAADLVNFINIM